jgi:hypothetical protein
MIVIYKGSTPQGLSKERRGSSYLKVIRKNSVFHILALIVFQKKSGHEGIVSYALVQNQKSYFNRIPVQHGVPSTSFSVRANWFLSATVTAFFSGTGVMR